MSNLPIYLTKIERLEAEYLTRFHRKLTRKWDTVTEEEADSINVALEMARTVLIGADWPDYMIEDCGVKLREWYDVERVNRDGA